tara:strand:- start:1002 stop:1658 length:657 start_codon:yes stop_codon:yes gene_type:complete
MCNEEITIIVENTINSTEVTVNSQDISISVDVLESVNNISIESIEQVNEVFIDVLTQDYAVEVIVDEYLVPFASDTISGKMKLYNALGVNIDGSVTQNIVKTNLDLKVDKVVGKSLLLDSEALRLTKFSGGRTEVDFGALPINEKEFTITDATVLATSNITAKIAYEAPTGKELDEIEMDSFDIICGQATNGTFKIIVKSLDGSYLADKFKINYSITI